MNAPVTIARIPFDLQAGFRALSDLESARNNLWERAEALHLAGDQATALDDQAAACDDNASRLRGIIVAVIEQTTGLRAEQLREVLA